MNNMEVRPEIYNNIGSLQIRKGELDEAKKTLNIALDKVQIELEDPQGTLD